MDSFMSEFNKDNNNKKDYETGYCKPPAEYKFKPGKSGNPYGRPKHPATLLACFERELGKKIKVKEDGKTKKVTKLTAFTKFIISQLYDKENEKLIMYFMKEFHSKINIERELNCNYEPIFEDSNGTNNYAGLITKAIHQMLDERYGIKRPSADDYEEDDDDHNPVSEPNN